MQDSKAEGSFPRVLSDIPDGTDTHKPENSQATVVGQVWLGTHMLLLHTSKYVVGSIFERSKTREDHGGRVYRITKW